MAFKTLLFGTAGTPISCKDRSSLSGVKKVAELGLSCMELEFVRGVRMTPELAEEVGKIAKEEQVVLTAHGPYYINLNSLEKEKEKASIKRILDTARIADKAGAYSITFHPAYYLKMDPEKVYQKVRKEMKSIIETLKQQDIKLWVRPETTGKATQFGSYQELIRLSQEIDQVMPCIDFAHLHARTQKLNTYDEFHKVLSDIEKGLGKKAINNMHIHMSGINYTAKGERNHLVLKESDMNYKDLLRVLKEFDAKGVVISESPNIETDALLMKRYYESLRN